MANHVRSLLTLPAAIISTDIGFHLLHVNPDNSLKLTLLKYAIWLLLLFPLYWLFGKLGKTTIKPAN